MSAGGPRALAAGLLLALSATAISLLQPNLSQSLKGVRTLDDDSPIPPPEHLRLMTFGYHAATADLLWASLLVEHGIRSSEKRPFAGVTRYLDGILALEPDHALVYQFVDTLLIYKPGAQASEKDARLTRKYLERGTRERPYDPEVWLHYGQFIAFLGPSLLTDDAEVDAWRKDGAFAIARAVDLGANASRGLAASTILSKAGETDASIAQLQRHYALTDDPETRHQIVLKLQHLKASATIESVIGAVEHEWRARYPFLRRDGALLLGPHREPATCAGPESRFDRRCAADWSAVASAVSDSR